MKFAKKETSEELHNLLKEVGYVPESEFSWFSYPEIEEIRISLSGHGSPYGDKCSLLFPSYSLCEVWEMLPKIKLRDIVETCIDAVGVWWFLSYLLSIDNITQAAHELAIWVIKNHPEEFIKHNNLNKQIDLKNVAVEDDYEL